MSSNPLLVHGRVVAIGDASVGKTSILNRLMEQKFDPYEQSTVGANWQLYVREVGGYRVEIQIWDTAGQEKFRSLGPLYYRSSVGAIVVYDVTNRASFRSVEEWIENFTNVAGTEVVVMLVGNKCDLTEQREVTAKEALDWARPRGYAVYETSAKTGENIESVFEALAEALVHEKQAHDDKDNPKLEEHEQSDGCGC